MASTSTPRSNGQMQQCDFFGCYMLISENPQAPKNKSYIGFTVNPSRRIRQHNGELSHGGARRTKALRPWRMLCIVYGFRSQVQGLQFEWTWQHPLVSKTVRSPVMAAGIKGCRLNPKGRQRPMSVEVAIRILRIILATDPYNKMPLTVTFFDHELKMQFDNLSDGSAVSIRSELHEDLHVFSKEHVKKQVPDNFENYCKICKINFKNSNKILICQNCSSSLHPKCASPPFIQGDVLIPNQPGSCSVCGFKSTWSDFLRNSFIFGCDDEEGEETETEEESDAEDQNLIPVTQIDGGRLLKKQKSILDFLTQPSALHPPADVSPVGGGGLRDRLFRLTGNPEFLEF
jgi:structure-specific endonuclease subunit SLX1